MNARKLSAGSRIGVVVTNRGGIVEMEVCLLDTLAMVSLWVG
jgi:hypothetical protein